MAGPARPDDSIRDLVFSTVRSAGFWSAIAAVVGVVAVAAGGGLYLGIEEIQNFAIGILVIGLALLFLALVLSPRAVAMFLVGRRGRYGVNMVVMTVAFFAIAVLINFLFFRSTVRYDVTATRVFTLAPQTVQTLDDLDTQVRANAFFRPTEQGNVREQAEDLLNEFARRTRQFSYRFVDPELNRSLALQYNVSTYPTVVFEDVERGTQQAISALTEQQFVTGILVVTGQEQKRVYFLTGHKEVSGATVTAAGQPDQEGFDFALQGMQRDNYIVQPLNLTQVGQVPEDAAVLVIAGPEQDLNAPDKDALIQYIKRGGRIVALFDPGTPDTFLDLISPWGVTMGRHSIADAVSNVAGRMLTPLVQRSNAQYGPDAAIVGQLDVTFFPAVTSIEPVLPPDEMPPFIGFIPLARTTPASWLETNVDSVSYEPGVDQRGPFAIAAVVEATGTVDESERHPLARFVIFGDSDFAKNKFFFSSDNADFLLNSVNWLADDYELISIRPKLFPFRQLVVNTRERDFIRWSSWFFPPIVMIFFGAVVWWRRR